MRAFLVLFWQDDFALSEDRTTFVARAAHPNLENGEASGRISIDRFILRFDAVAGGALEIPLIRLQMERLESGELQLTDPQQPEAALYTYDPRILEHRALREQACTRNQVLELRREDEVKRRMKLVLLFLLGFTLLAAAAWVAMGLMVRAAVTMIPPRIEEQFGEKVMKEVKAVMTVYKDPKIEAKLNAAVAPLLASLPPTTLPYKFYLIDEPLPNACALPGGHVLVTRGLMNICERPEELCGVIAHEIAHVNQKHIFRKIGDQVGPYVIFRILAKDDNTMMGTFGKGSELLVNQSFSQDIESEADSVGWDYLVKARIDPRGMRDIFVKFQKLQERLPLSDVGFAAFSSHPPTEKRIRMLEAKWEKLKDKDHFVPIDGGGYW